jgi:hypothetical protein
MSKKMEINQFRFEDYKTADKARSDYIKKHAKTKHELVNFFSNNPKMMPTEKQLKEISAIRKTNNYRRDAMTDILKFHPIGSDVESLIRTIEEAGANINVNIKTDNKIRYDYEHGNPWLNGKHWIMIIYTTKDGKNISNIKIDRSGNFK